MIQWWQILLLTLYSAYQICDELTIVSSAGSPVFAGFITGLIMGDLPTGLLIGANLQLVVLGVGYLTHSSKFWNEKKWWYDGKKTVVTDKEVAFGSGTFYKQDQDLVDDQVEVAFGDAKIYYDNAEMLGDFATLNIEVAFGNATVYVPQHWRVDLKVETSFGAAKADAPVAPTNKTLIIRGEVAFGKLGVVYVK